MMTALVPVSLIFFLFIYGKILTSFGPQKTLALSSLFSSGLLFLCYLGVNFEIPIASALLYLVREIYVVLLVEQFWSFVDSTLDQKTAKRYSGMILAISTMGGVTGGLFVHSFVESLGNQHMILIGSLSCVPCFFLGNLAFRLVKQTSVVAKVKTSHAQKSLTETLGLGSFKRHPVLLLILSLILTSQCYSAFVTFHFQGTLFHEIPSLEKQTAYSGLFYGLTNGISVLLQLIVLPVLLRFVSLGSIHRLIPCVHVIAISMSLLFPGLASASVALLLFKSFDYSLFKAAKEILYIPLPFDARYRAKEVIDVFGYRLGKGAASGGIAMVNKIFMLSPSVTFPLFGLFSSLLWVLFALPLKKMSENKIQKQETAP